MKLKNTLRDLSHHLTKLEHRFAVVGGLAAWARLLQVIEARGYNRGQDLMAKWHEIKEEIR